MAVVVPTRLPARPGVMAGLLSILLVLGVLLAAPASAATFVVTANRITGVAATDDPAPGACAVDDCSLREAVLAANASPGADTITFAVDGVVALLQAAGVEGATPAAVNDLDIASGEDLTVSGPIVIDGASLAPGPDSRILQVDGADLTLQDVSTTGSEADDSGGAVHVSSGSLVWRGGTAADHISRQDGGVVYLASGALEMDGVTLLGNRAAGNGGAIGSDDHEDVVITDTLMEGNVAGDPNVVQGPPLGGDGGAMDLNAADAAIATTITGSSFVGNVALNTNAPALGGAISFSNGTADIARSVLRLNGETVGGATAQGGAIHSDGTTLSLTQTTVEGNTAEDVGGGLALGGDSTVEQAWIGQNTSGGAGGGLYGVGGTIQLTNSTVDGNEAVLNGAGVHVGPNADAALLHVTLTDNEGRSGLYVETGGSAALRSSIIAGHTLNCGVDGTLVSVDFNLEDANHCALAMPADLVDTDPALAAAADNGGPGQGADGTTVGLTRGLAAGSPAVDSADPAVCGAGAVEEDQRTVTRPQGSACDRGAFEREAGPTPTPTPTPTTPPGGGCTPGMGGSPTLPTGVSRVEGLNRIQTAIAASQAVCGDLMAPAVVLTRADLFPDAQAGTPLAIELEAPLLLTAPTALSADTEEEIERILPTGRTVYLLGGTAALSADVEQRLEDLGYATIRYGGVDRFETAQVIAEEGLDDPGTILLTNGGVFADSVLAGAAASTFRNDLGAVDAAVLLTSGADQSPFTAAYLEGRDDDPTLIAIGSAAATAHPDAEAVTGPTRFETAVAVAERFFPAPTVVGIARSDEFADALSGGALIGRPAIGPGPILLVASDDLPTVAADWLAANAGTLTRALVFGGTAAVQADVEAEIAAILQP